MFLHKENAGPGGMHIDAMHAVADLGIGIGQLERGL
jgi:hypothetical protein